MLDKLFKTIEKITPQKYRWILNHDGFKRYFANTGWMFGGRIISLFLSFFIVTWLARYLGPDDFGTISYVLAFAGLFAFIANLGVDGILSRELVTYPERRDELMGTAFGLKIFGGLIAFLVSAFAAFIFIQSLFTRWLVVLYSFVFILQAVDVISTYFQAKVLAKKNAQAILTATIISSILKVVLILTGSGLFWLALIYLLDAFWQGIGFLWAYKTQKLKISSWKYTSSLAKKIFNSSWLLMLSSASVFIYLKIDQVMIGYFMGDNAVGIYAAAVKFVEIWYFVPTIICASFFPAIINARKSNVQTYHKRLKALYLLMIVVAVAIAIPSSVLAPWLVSVLFGEAYLASVVILKIYIWSGVGLFVGLVISQYLLSENRVKTIFYYNILTMVANVSLNLILIPRLGLPGAAWATLISYSAGPFVMILLNLNLKNINKDI